MISAEDFCALLKSHGFGAFTGVPCSYLSGLVELLDVTGRYLPAPNEGAALAIAAGAALAGDQMGVLIQNSGLGNLINPLTSLVMPYRIGVAVFMSLRGWPDPARDEPQHAVMGSTSHALLDALGVWHWTLDGELSSLETILQQAADRVAAGVPAFVLVPKGTVQKGAAPEGTGRAVPAAFGRAEALRTLAKTVPVSAAVVSTTGYTSRELCAVADRPSHFYMQGSMGHASAIGLGFALRSPHRPVVVLDGDGAALMHLGTLSAIGYVAPRNLVHVVLDDGVYASTGAQPTTSATTDFARLARAAGYRTAVACADSPSLARALNNALDTPGPHCVWARIDAGGSTPPRVTDAIGPAELRKRFSQWAGERA